MRASDQTRTMLQWWCSADVYRADLAVRRPDGAMAWHHGRHLHDLPLAWARAENVRHADVYIRPARGERWPLLFLDDVPCDVAARVARKYAALVIRTSTAGACHIWLRCAAPLHEHERCRAQRWLASRVGADTGSVSGEHLGRLAGFRNWKRHGVWVNLVLSTDDRPPWHSLAALSDPLERHDAEQPPAVERCPRTGTDTSPSGSEWGWVCGMPEAGFDPNLVHARLVGHASPRRGPDAERYATRTIDRALRRRCTPPPPTGYRRDR